MPELTGRNDGTSGRKMDQVKYFVPMCIAVAALAAPVTSFARDVKIGGGVGAGYEFDNRQYKHDASAEQEKQSPTQTATIKKDERYSRIRIAPLITLTSPAARDEILLRYSPGFRHDLVSSDNDVDHDLSASLRRYVTKNWQLKLSDKYLLTDRVENQDVAYPDTTAGSSDNVAETDSTVKLSDNENRRKYWTNNLALRSEHAYSQDSLFSLGYGYSILENIDGGTASKYENFDRHELSSAVAHRFTSAWKLSVSGSYVRGLYDEIEAEQTTATEATEENPADEKDLNEYRTATVLESNLLDHQSQKLSYSFFAVDHDAAQLDNATIHDMTLGWQWDISKELMFGLGAGPTYTKTEGSDGVWGYNGNLAFRYGFELGNIGLTANRGFERQNFTGTDENGLREFWQSKLSMNCKVLEGLSADFYSSYRYEDEEVITAVASGASDQETTADSTDFTTTSETFNRKRFSTGASFDYTFRQWYKAALSYGYSLQDSEKTDDSFNEHKVALILSYEKELFNW